MSSKWLDLQGQDDFLQKMLSLIQQDKFPQVVLIEGRAGIGKAMVAGKLAVRHYCLEGTACGKCEGCTWALTGNHNDLLFVEDNSESLKIEDAKALQEHLEIEADLSLVGHAHVRPARMMVVPDVDRFNMTAINKLLKILEEIPDNARVIFTTSRKNLLLDTFLSRCVCFRLSPPKLESSCTIVQQNLMRQGKEPLSEGQLLTLLKRWGRSPGQVLSSIAKQDSLLGSEERWDELLLASKPSEILNKAQQINSDKSVDAGNLAMELEFALNRMYRRMLANQDGASVFQDPLLMEQRRHLLRDLKDYGHKRKIKLNSLLAIEAMGLVQGGYTKQI